MFVEARTQFHEDALVASHYARLRHYFSPVGDLHRFPLRVPCAGMCLIHAFSPTYVNGHPHAPPLLRLIDGQIFCRSFLSG